MWFLLSWLALILIAGQAVRLFLRARTVRVVHCPGTGTSAAVTLHTLPALLAPRTLEDIGRCSFWPDRATCAQTCIEEIHASPSGCAFRRILAQWYHGQPCAFCRRPVPPVSAGGPQPGLMSPQGQLLQWQDIAPARLFEILEDHHAVCASCAVVEEFRHRYPERIVERPPRTM